MTEIDTVEGRARSLLKSVDQRVQEAQQAVTASFGQLDINNVRGLPERTETMRAAIEDFNDLLIVKNTLRAVLGRGIVLIVKLTTGEKIIFPEES